ncbi:MAG: hypothetical protein WC655_04385 [Candidatus Hydrogenedentales bacterium]|jgi:hypothetical protein
MNRILGVIVFAFILVCSQAHAATVLSYSSSPTSWIGEGESGVLTESANIVFTPSSLYWNGIQMWVEDNVNFESYFIVLFPPTGQSLAEGNYLNAERSPTATVGGLDVSMKGHGANVVAGQFRILELEVDGGGVPTKLAVDFVEYVEGVETDWVKGSIRYNSDVLVHHGPAAVPIDSNTELAILACALAFAGCFVVKRRLGKVR